MALKIKQQAEKNHHPASQESGFTGRFLVIAATSALVFTLMGVQISKVESQVVLAKAVAENIQQDVVERQSNLALYLSASNAASIDSDGAPLTAQALAQR